MEHFDLAVFSPLHRHEMMIIISHARNATRAVTPYLPLGNYSYKLSRVKLVLLIPECQVPLLRFNILGDKTRSRQIKVIRYYSLCAYWMSKVCLWACRGEIITIIIKNCDIHLRYAQYRSRCRRVVVAAWQRVDSLQIKKYTGPSSSAAESRRYTHSLEQHSTTKACWARQLRSAAAAASCDG